MSFVKDPAWFGIQSTATLLENTNGKDKLLKTSQYCIKLSVEVIRILKERQLLGKYLPQIVAASAVMKAVAKQMSVGRKLFRFGRSVHCIYMMRSLLDEKNTFLQVIGLNSWFWNAVWFVCDHVAWLNEVNAINRDPLLPLNRLASVLMQVFQFLFNARQLAMYYDEEHRLLEELEIVRKRLNRGRSRSLDVDASSIVFDPKRLSDPLDPVERLEAALLRTRIARRQLIPTFIKTLGDIVICFDFGFQWDLPALVINLAGVIGGLAGCYTEVLTAKQTVRAKIQQQDRGQRLLEPPRR